MRTIQTVVRAVDTANLVINIEVEEEVLSDRSVVYNVLMFIHDNKQPRSTALINHSCTDSAEAHKMADELAKSLQHFTMQ